jgi:hypothetical protein
MARVTEGRRQRTDSHRPPVDDDPLVKAMLIGERRRGMEIERARMARADGPLTRTARRLEHFLGIR